MDPKILIVEDKAVLAYDIVDRLNGFGYHNLIGPFDNAEEALQECGDTLPDIAVLDIRLKGELNGIDLAKKLNEKSNVPVVYLTNLEDEEIYNDSISTFPVAFINKPFTNNELRVAMVNAIRALDQEFTISKSRSEDVEVLEDRIFIRNGKGKYHVKLDEILWIQSNGGDMSTIMTADKLEADPKSLPTVGHNLSRLEDRLNFYPYLIRGSRYYIVNLKHVDRILDQQPNDRTSPRKAVMIAENEITIGDKYRKNVMDRFHIV